MTKKITYAVLLIAYASMFLLSGYSKAQSITSFELYFYSFGLFSWQWTEVLTRLLIGTEVLLGLLLLGQFTYKRALQASLFTLVGFSCLLMYLSFTDPENNCHCFGDFIEFDAISSLIKNIAFIAVGAFLLLKKTTLLRFNRPIWVTPILLITIIGGTFVYRPISLSKQSINSDIKNTPFNSSLLETAGISISDGKYAICYFSLGCSHCKDAANKISILNEKYKEDITVLMGFIGKKENIKYFKEATNTGDIQSFSIEKEAYISQEGPKVPFIYIVDNGTIVRKDDYSTLSEASFEALFTDN